MEHRQLGWTGEKLSVIGLGTWAMGGKDWSYGWGPQRDEDSINTIHKALDHGINWIDTAPVYGLGHAEEVVGRAIKGYRDKVFLATKCGLVWDSKKEITGMLTSKSIRKEIEDSLRRLQTDYIDLYQIHWPNPEDQIEEAWETLVRLREEGKVRYLGVSNFSVGQMQRVGKISRIASLQPPYNMFNREIERGILQYCDTKKIGVIVYSPLASGFLTGKYDRDRVARLYESDWRRRSPLFMEPQLSVNLRAVEQLKVIAGDLSLTLSQLSIAWTLRRQEVTGAIVGARTPEQITETVKSADVRLEDEVLNEIEDVLTKRSRELEEGF